MLKRAARQADALARLLPDTDPDKAAVRARISRLGAECGCSAGGAFLVAASLSFLAYAVFFAELSVRLVVLGTGFVFACSMLGKAAGILTAVARLTVLRRRLAGHIAGPVDARSRPAARGV
jgi:hypothetical protein